MGGGGVLPGSPTPTAPPGARTRVSGDAGERGQARVRPGGVTRVAPRRLTLGSARLPYTSPWLRGPGRGAGEGRGRTAPKMAPAPPRRRTAGEGGAGEGCRAAPPPPRLALLPGADRRKSRSVGRTPGRGGRGRPCARARQPVPLPANSPRAAGAGGGRFAFRAGGGPSAGQEVRRERSGLGDR